MTRRSAVTHRVTSNARPMWDRPGYPGRRPVSQKVDKRTKDKLIRKLQESLRSLKRIDTSLRSLIKKLEKHQKAIRGTKWGTTAGTVISSILCFTPFAPLGVAGLAASSAAGLGATIGDVTVTKKAQKQVERYAKQAETYLKQGNKILQDVMKITYKFKSTGKKIRLAVKYKGLTQAGRIGLMAASKASLGIGAAMSVVSAIYTQIKVNPSLKNARKLQKDIKQQCRVITKEIANLQKNL